MWTLKDGVPYFYEENQHALGRSRIEDEGHTAISYADAMLILNPEIPIEALYQNVLSKVNSEFARYMSLVTDEYPLQERESWYVQIQEARDLTSKSGEKSAQEYPWIHACADASGESLEQKAASIIQRYSGFCEKSGFYTGIRHKHKNELLSLVNKNDRQALESYDYKQWWSDEKIKPQELAAKSTKQGKAK